MMIVLPGFDISVVGESFDWCLLLPGSNCLPVALLVSYYVFVLLRYDIAL